MTTSDEQSQPSQPSEPSEPSEAPEAPDAPAGHHERPEGEPPAFDVSRDPTPGVPDHAAADDGEDK